MKMTPTVKFFIIAALAAVVLCVIAVSAIYSYESHRDANNSAASAENKLVDACLRENVLRSADNKSHYADWHVDKEFLKLGKAQANVKVPSGAKQSTKDKAKFGQVKADKHYLTVITNAIAAKEWVPITDCSGSNVTEATLVPPPAIAFNVKLPPKSAF